jgi:hypothetical protein
VYECPGVQPVFLSKEQAIDYATCRACFRLGEIRILKSNGTVERIIPFDETERRLSCICVIAFTNSLDRAVNCSSTKWKAEEVNPAGEEAGLISGWMLGDQ